MKFLLTCFSVLLAPSFAFAQFEPAPQPETPPQIKPAHPLKVYVGCTFVDTTVNLDCAEVGKLFSEEDHLVTIVSKAESEYEVELTEISDSPREQYVLKITDHTGQISPSTYIFQGASLNFLATLSPIIKNSLITRVMIQIFVPYHSIHEYNYNPSGQLVLTLVPRAGDDKIPPPAKASPFYVQASGFGLLINQGSSINILGMPTVTAGYTNINEKEQAKKWVVEYSNSSRYNFIKTTISVPEVLTNSTGAVITNPQTGLPVYGSVNVPEKASNLSINNGLIVARTLTKHWAIAAFIRDNTDPSSNFKNQFQTHVGIEYDLVPYLVTNDNELSINYLIGGNHQTYFEPNADGKAVQNIATHALSIYYVFHFSRVDVNGSVAGTSTVTDWKQWGFGGQVGGRIYLNKRKTFTFDPSLSFGFKNNLVNNPGDPSSTYQLLQLMGVGTGSTPTTFTGRVGFTYRFGKNLIRQKTPYWQFTSDEVPNNF